MLLLITTAAYAGHREGDLEFDRLDRHRGTITYELDPRSVQMLRHLDVTPTMAIWQDGELLWSEPLTRASGTVTPPDGMNKKTVEVTLVGFHRGWWIRSINGHSSLALAGAKDRSRHERGDHEACDHHTRSRYAQSNDSHRVRDEQREAEQREAERREAERREAEQRADRYGHADTSTVTAAIEACDFALWDDDLTLECAQAASRSRYDAVALVEACDDAFWDDEDVVACVSSY